MLAGIVRIFVAAAVIAAGPGEPTLNFMAEVTNGSNVVLAWAAPTCTSVYIPYVGLQTPSGTARIRLEEAAQLTLFADCGGKVFARSISVGAQGARGDEWPPTDSFRQPARRVITVTSAAGLLANIHSILQDHLGHAVEEYRLRDGTYRFITTRREIGADAPHLRARNVAFLVDVKLPSTTPGAAEVSVSTAMQFKRRLESTWRQEPSNERHAGESRRVLSLVAVVKR